MPCDGPLDEIAYAHLTIKVTRSSNSANIARRLQTLRALADRRPALVSVAILMVCT
jgi:hypothetical protein